MSLESTHELDPCEFKVMEEDILCRVEGPHKLTGSRDIAVEALVDAKQAQ